MSIVTQELVEDGPGYSVWEILDDAGYRYLERRTYRPNGTEASRERITDPSKDGPPERGPRPRPLTPLAERIRRERLTPVVLGKGIPKMVAAASAVGAFAAVLVVELAKVIL